MYLDPQHWMDFFMTRSVPVVFPRLFFVWIDFFFSHGQDIVINMYFLTVSVTEIKQVGIVQSILYPLPTQLFWQRPSRPPQLITTCQI